MAFAHACRVRSAMRSENGITRCIAQAKKCAGMSPRMLKVGKTAQNHKKSALPARERAFFGGSK